MGIAETAELQWNCKPIKVKQPVETWNHIGQLFHFIMGLLNGTPTRRKDFNSHVLTRE